MRRETPTKSDSINMRAPRISTTGRPRLLYYTQLGFSWSSCALENNYYPILRTVSPIDGRGQKGGVSELSFCFKKHSDCIVARIYTRTMFQRLFCFIWSSLLLLLHPQQVLSKLIAFQDPSNNKSIAPIMRTAWHCHGRNQRELVEHLRQANIIRHPQVAQVMQQVDRKYYLPKGSNQDPYADAPQVIGHGQTISAPHMHAHALEELLPYLQQPSTSTATASVKILDVGCGSGYLTACLGRLVHATKNKESILGRPGQVFGVDIYPELVERTRGNILSSPVDCELLESKTIQLQVANGWEGLPEEAPFDAIHVGAAAESLPRALAQQLKVGGVLIVPIGPYGGAQKLYKIERVQQASNEFDESDYRVKALLGVQYVPLVKEL